MLLGGLARLAGVGVGVGARLLVVGVRGLALLVRIGVRLAAGRLRVLVGLAAGRLGVAVRLDPGRVRLDPGIVDGLAGLVFGVGLERAGGFAGGGQDLRGVLADSLQLTLHDLGLGLPLPAALEPVGQPLQELVDLAAVVAAAGQVEGGAADPIDAVLLHPFLLAAGQRALGQVYELA